MSWDLYIEEGEDEKWWGNYTHNTNAMIRAASIAPRPIPESPPVAAEVLFHAPVLGACWGDFDGRPAREAGLFARDIIAEMKRDPERYLPLNPINGWGSMETLLGFLRAVARHCEANPDATFRASG
jgi:hypothetical protein